ncbi:MAG: hypothetical protein GTO45_22310 [Candidatus Aminicenantes bacterium]|nr:hypothetical protein [Candidatus Aminicenantes bacterium]NIM81499.1 hypothetical protein [Candidatus Aminicenantes bacterium]NIN20869.1 hypothetical protein [Candidatus Aminicenantes bacterium]NIN44690.1 hypothetical protein [Candidatus Aminicenantes bacterium]NIN87498.1 hypothetical protein [Candidatus Aminicenantes bacterium]
MIKLKTMSRLVISTITLVILFHFISSCKIQNGEPKNQKEKEKEVIQEKKRSQKSEKKGEPFDILSRFVSTGWMGDGHQGPRYVRLFEAWKQNPHSEPVCVQVTYTPGSQGWAGIYWQNKPDNWGDQPGQNFQKAGYKKLTLWARGDKGGEIVEFKAGGINAPGKRYRDSFEVSIGKIILKKEWRQYTIDLEGEDLSSVIGGFCWVAASSSNPEGLTFYIDDVYYEF